MWKELGMAYRRHEEKVKKHKPMRIGFKDYARMTQDDVRKSLDKQFGKSLKRKERWASL